MFYIIIIIIFNKPQSVLGSQWQNWTKLLFLGLPYWPTPGEMVAHIYKTNE